MFGMQKEPNNFAPNNELYWQQSWRNFQYNLPHQEFFRRLTIADNWEAGASRYHGDTIEDPPGTPGASWQYDMKTSRGALNRSPTMPRDVSLTDSWWQRWRTGDTSILCKYALVVTIIRWFIGKSETLMTDFPIISVMQLLFHFIAISIDVISGDERQRAGLCSVRILVEIFRHGTDDVHAL